MARQSGPVLAVYDFRSKQEFIYRTNRMREITGASELIAKMYGCFLEEPSVGTHIRNDWRNESPKPLLDELGNPAFADDEVGIIVYEGGGNLLVLYKDRDSFKKANRVFSCIVIDRSYSLSMICAASDWQSDKGFEWNRSRAFEQFDHAKKLECPSIPCNVLPYTQVDRVTYQPIVQKDDKDYGDVTREGKAKQAAYNQLPKQRKSEGRHIDELGTQKGKDSLIAVLYFDGNSIGERVKAAVRDRPQGKTEVDAMREFSKGLQGLLVERTKSQIALDSKKLIVLVSLDNKVSIEGPEGGIFKKHPSDNLDPIRISRVELDSISDKQQITLKNKVIEGVLQTTLADDFEKLAQDFGVFRKTRDGEASRVESNTYVRE